jgi:preprotein translocase subunit SecA
LLREQWRAGPPTGLEVITPSFALFAEALRRTLGICCYDVQLIAGLALSRNTIAEMETGEGKTIAAALAAFAYALSGRGVHVMTANAYLARRDQELLRPVYELLNVSSGLLRRDASAQRKRAAYACDVTYGPGYEFGFDYLRDQLGLLARPKRRLGEDYRALLQGRDRGQTQTVQRGHRFAIVDEADSVMIDEATTPLILSGASSPEAPNPNVYLAAMQVADRLEAGRDFVLDADARILHLTEQGVDNTCTCAAEVARNGLERPWIDYVRQALRAKLLLQRDVDYVVDQQSVLLVDQNTGRIFANRSWRDGLRQAVEAREGIPITPENQSVAHVSRQRYLWLYHGLSGLTGTAAGSEREFWRFYHLPVVAVPLRTPSIRRILPTRFFIDRRSKWAAIAAEVQRIHQTGQPVLAGTRTIQDSETLARQLEAKDVPFHLLNGKQDEQEACIVARAGEPGAITVATNMAGRGTDIKLAHRVPQLGGLHVIGCEPHESARVDRQLIGRCARQGDPGSCQFFASAEDRLIAAHSPRLARRMRRLAQPNGEIAADLSSEIASLQQRIERKHFSARRRLVARDHWVEEVLSKLAEAT